MFWRMGIRQRITEWVRGGGSSSAPALLAPNPNGSGHNFNPLNFLRSYKAAQSDRLVADWLSAGGDINQELKSQLPVLRSRAREAEQNSNMAQRFLSLCETHIVGPEGFALQLQGKLSGELDSETNKLIEQEYRKWSRTGVCENSGRHSMASLCRSGIRSAARDGELLWRMHDVRPDANNPWGFFIEALDPARLDHLLNEDLKNGNRIRLGIELTPSGRPVAFHLKKGGANTLAYNRDSHERVVAEDIIHWFRQERPEQLRGPTWMASGLLTLHHIDACQEAAIVACRAGASKMGFFKQTEMGAGAHALSDSKGADGSELTEFEPGHIGKLPVGWDFTGFDPRYPHEAYADFMKIFHRDLSVGWGVSYHALTGDLTDVNFSSIRSGTLEERDQWKVLQDLFSDPVLRRVYSRWLSAALMNGRFFSQQKKMNAAMFLEIYGEHRWQGRRWPWVDPEKDINTVIKSINAKLNSPQRAAAELGVDVEEILDDLVVFAKMIADKKLTPGPIIGDKAGEASGDEEGKKDAA